MNHLKGMSYDAVGIEHAFAIFMQQAGKRGLPHDADVFRSGDIRSLGKVIEHFAEHLHKRARHIQWPSTANGSSWARIESAIKSLHSLAADMKASRAKEPQDYHWLIIGELVLVITALLDELGV